MENGFDGRSLAEKFSELGVSATPAEQSNSHNHGNNSDSNLFQVLKAVEAAEATIKQQVLRIFIPPSHFLSLSLKNQCYSSDDFITKFSNYPLHYCLIPTSYFFHAFFLKFIPCFLFLHNAYCQLIITFFIEIVVGMKARIFSFPVHLFFCTLRYGDSQSDMDSQNNLLLGVFKYSWMEENTLRLFWAMILLDSFYRKSCVCHRKLLCSSMLHADMSVFKYSQVEENNRLRIELQKKIQELEKYVSTTSWVYTNFVFPLRPAICFCLLLQLFSLNWLWLTFAHFSNYFLILHSVRMVYSIYFSYTGTCCEFLFLIPKYILFIHRFRNMKSEIPFIKQEFVIWITLRAYPQSLFFLCL